MAKKTKHDLLCERVERLEKIVLLVIPALHRKPRMFTIREVDDLVELMKELV